MTKISLPAIKLNFSEKAQTFLTTFLFKKLLMLLCLLAFLAIVVAALFSTQFATKQDLSGELQSRSKLDGMLVDSGPEKVDEGVEAGRDIMLKVEELANIELARILKVHFGSDKDVEGSIHYDLLDISDYSNPLLTNWKEADGASALIQSENFLVETTIVLKFAGDEQVGNFDVQEVQSLLNTICQLNIVKMGQGTSILLKGPESARLFFCPEVSKDNFALEEVVAN